MVSISVSYIPPPKYFILEVSYSNSHAIHGGCNGNESHG